MPTVTVLAKAQLNHSHDAILIELIEHPGPAAYREDGRPFRKVLRDLGLTSNQVWGLTQTDREWAEKLETALTAARRNDLKHGTNAAYVHGCVCQECREHQQIRMRRGRN